MKALRISTSYALLLGLAAFLMAPFVWMVLVSLHPSRQPIPTLENIIPDDPQWQNYKTVLFDLNLPVGYSYDG